MKNRLISLIEKLDRECALEKSEWVFLLNNYDDEVRTFAAEKAAGIAKKYYGNKVFTRGLIEITNYCKNDCYYCGIRRSNKNVERYRLTKEDILECCDAGYELGYRTFVMQGGEDSQFDDDFFVDVIHEIKLRHPDCAITLSLGERSKASYEALYNAGADRYLLRHETASDELYSKLHPAELSLANRKECLWNLKSIGYQVGCGFMVGSPRQTAEHLAEDMIFIHELGPQMVGIGPFIPAEGTPFAGEEAGSVELTLFLLSLIRIMEKKVLIPATTALGTLAPNGRELGLEAGANVVMPNLSPVSVRKKYSLYDNKICTGEEAAECRGCLGRRVESVGYELVVDRGDYIE